MDRPINTHQKGEIIRMLLSHRINPSDGAYVMLGDVDYFTADNVLKSLYKGDVGTAIAQLQHLLPKIIEE